MSDTMTTCGHCSQTFYYDPSAHRCPGEWEAMLAAAGIAPPANPYAGMSWDQECVAKVMGES